ncbi:MAG: radical SAM protein [Thermocladium sp.]
MIPISTMVTGRGTVSFKIKGRYGVDKPSEFSSIVRPIVSWNITRKCNLKCIHCYIDAGMEDEHELSNEEAMRLVDQFKEVGVPLILMSGGEPLMRRDLIDIAKHAAGLGIKLVLSTNGTMITREVAEELKGIGFSYIGISLDSIDAEYHDKFRGVKGAFSLALAGIRNSLDAGLDVGLRFTVTAMNIERAADYIDFAASIGVNRVTFYHLSASGRAGKLGREWWYSPQQYARFMETIIKYAEKYAGKLEIETTLAPYDGIYIALRSGGDPEPYLRFVESTGGCGRKIISIYPNGDVYPCQFIDFVKLGNIRQKPLRDILVNGLDLFVNTEKYLRGPKCSNCRFKKECKGGDRARAYYLGGDMYGDDPICPIPELFNNRSHETN